MQTTLEFNDPKKTNAVYEAGYAQLNPAQKEAVDLIDGPVLVLAGPGTGKTQILALRIGNILKKTDAKPHNILCMTFTEAGVIAMRNRLLEYIGPEAYNIPIYTFHAFGNQVIQENMDVFGSFRELNPVSDLERIEIMEELIDGFPEGSPLKRLYSAPYAYLQSLQRLYDDMKSEGWSAEHVKEICQYEIDHPEEQAELKYKRKYKEFKMGDLNPRKVEELKKKREKLIAAASSFDAFNNLMKNKGRYDFADMLSWVLDAFQANENLLLNYQERYQYFLIDEFQDTNGIQKQLIEILASYWPKPNLFVVGDDDQAIFKFQGASMDNISDFHDKYKPKVIMLTDNYRSSQAILRPASTLINFNEERISNKLNIDKNLYAKGEYANIMANPIARIYKKVAQEESDIVNQVLQLREKGVKLGEIAIIYRNHRHVSNLTTIFEKLNIPLNMVRRVNILEDQLVRNILTILEYIWVEHNSPNEAQGLLFQMMHFNFFGIDSRDASKISLHCRRTDIRQKLFWRDVIGDEVELAKLNLKTPEKVLALSENIEYWIRDLSSMTIQTLFEKILQFGNIIMRILQSEQKTWHMQVVATLFDFIKEETARNYKMTLGGLLDIISRMEWNDLPLGLNKIVHAEDGVNFVTAHGVKGLEFEYVFIISALQDAWEKPGHKPNSFSFPEALKTAKNQFSIQDERRLFFVAMTRAKKFLQVSCAEQDAKGKGKEKARFMGEADLEFIHTKVDEDIVFSYYEKLLSSPEPKIELLDHALIDKVLNGYVLNVTNLNKYLKCPLSFYYEVILRVPGARTKYLGFGNAIHKAFDNFFIRRNENGSTPPVEKLIQFFKNAMDHYSSHFTPSEKEDMTKYGINLVKKYYELNVASWDLAKEIISEKQISRVHYKGIPIKGNIDRVDIFPDHVSVRDYKTGSIGFSDKRRKGPSDKFPMGGDYWRQIIFYKILLDAKSSDYKVKNGVIDYIQGEKKSGQFIQEFVNISVEDIELVGKLIEEAYEKIKDHQFTERCGEDNCTWCQFVESDQVFKEMLKQEESKSKQP